MTRHPTAPRHRLPSAATIAAGLLAAVLPAPCVAAQTPSTAPQQAVEPSEGERRFREIAEYIRTRGELDAATRADLVRAAATLDADLAVPSLARATAVRLLAIRVQAASLLDDRDAMERAFARLEELTGLGDALVLAWARERIGFAEFEAAHALLEGRAFAADRRVDADIARARALIGLGRFLDAQAALNATPARRSAQQLSQIAALSKRITDLNEAWNAEIVLMARDIRRGDLPLVEIVTPKGPILLELFEDDAPNTVGNFIEHVERGTYDGTRFHRVLRGFGVQGGDPETASGAAGGTGTGGWLIPDEPSRSERRALLSGRVVMASQPEDISAQRPRANSAGCQFMILVDHAEELAGSHTPFGRVTEGLEVVRQLGADDAILSARVLRKRDREYRGVRLEEVSKGDFSMPRRPGTATRALETRINPPAPPRAPAQPQPVPVNPIDLSPTRPPAKP